jgi:2-C-methyl-D-erythritol 2,4-cyclodiphosphate synthase
MRVGIGYDIHRLVSGRKLILGGVEVPFGKGLEGHSDADVLLHAVADAMLGALSLGDIGTHFPNDDPQYKGASSAGLLGKVNDLIRKKGFSVNNADAVLIMEEPKISPFFPEMKKRISDILRIKGTGVSIKATTNERIGPLGKGEAIAGWAVVILKELSGG